MHGNTIRAIATWCAIAAITVAAASGCGSDDKANSTTTTQPAPTTMSSIAAQADSATSDAVTHAFVTFFDTKTPADQRVGLVENGSTFTPVLQAQADSPASPQTTATVSAVRTIDATHASVTYTILMGGTPVLPDQSGQAVQENGQWKVAATTFCALATLQGPVPGC